MSDEIKNAENEAPKAEQSTELSQSALDEVVGGNAVSGPVSSVPTTLHKYTNITLKRG
jgi:hypothetical protein